MRLHPPRKRSYDYETVVLKMYGRIDYDLIKDYFKTLNVFSDNPSELIPEALGIIGQLLRERITPP